MDWPATGSAHTDPEGGRPDSGVAAEELFRLAMQQSAVGMCLVDAAGQFLSVNAALCSFLGRDEAWLLRHSWQDLTDPEDLRADEVLAARLAAGEIASYRLLRRGRRPDGSLVWGDLTVSELRGRDGVVRHFIGQLADVTDRVVAERRLAESEARYRMLAENASDIVLHIATDDRVEWVSPSVTAALGWDPQALVGRRLTDLVHGEDAEPERWGHGTELSGGVPRLVEARFATADGGWRWMADRRTALLDDAGEVLGRIDALRDIDAEVQARQALSESQLHFRMLAENASDVVFEVAPDDTFRWFSPSVFHLLGWTPEELIGRTGAFLIEPEDFALVVAAREHPRGGLISIDELRFRRRDGSTVWMSGLAREIRDPDNTFSGWVVGLRDVEGLVLARERARTGQARLQATLDSLLDPHVLLQAVRDAAGEVVDFSYADVNEAACLYNGTTRDQLVGSSVVDRFPSAGSELVDWYRESTESGPPLILDDYPDPHATLAEDRHIEIRAVRVDDAMSVTWRDVTERQAAALALADSEAHLRLLVENATDVVVRTTTTGVLDWVSASVSRVLGWAPEDLVGKPVFALLHPQDVADAGGAQDPSETPQPLSVECRMRTAAGGYRWLMCSSRPILGAHGEVTGMVAGWRDVDAEVCARQALTDADARYRLVADSVYDVVLRIRDGRILWVSPSLTRELGWAPEDWIGHHIYEFLLRDDQRAMALDQVEAYAKQTAVRRFQLRDRSGSYHHVETHTREVRTETGEPDGLVTTFRTIDAEVRAEAELDRRVKLDDLTGALKRDAALEGLSAIVSRVRRSPGQYTALAFCDVDDFKGINDAHGHAGGDDWLTAAARRIGETIRSVDILARMGGDEFLVVLDGVHDLAEATAIANKITSAVSQPITIDGEPVIATMSVGVTLAGPQEPVDAIINRADRAMYKAKRAGRNQVIPVPGPPQPDPPTGRQAHHVAHATIAREPTD